MGFFQPMLALVTLQLVLVSFQYLWKRFWRKKKDPKRVGALIHHYHHLLVLLCCTQSDPAIAGLFACIHACVCQNPDVHSPPCVCVKIYDAPAIQHQPRAGLHANQPDSDLSLPSKRGSDPWRSHIHHS